MQPRTVSEIAVHVGGRWEGDGARLIAAVAGLESAGATDVTFLANRRYVRTFRASAAGCVLVGDKEDAGGKTVIRCADPYLAFAKVLELFHPELPRAPGVHPLAVVEGDEHGATHVAGVTALAFSFVGAGAKVGEGTVLHPHSYVGPGATVGRDCVLMPGSVVAHGCVVGDRVVLNPGAVVGGEGFGFVPTPTGMYKIPQTGRAVIGDDVEIGSNSNVDRAAVGDTVVKSGSKIDNLVQVGHGATIGEHCLMVSYSGVAGSTTLGRGVVLAARATVLGHLDIGDGVQVAALAMVTEDTPAGARRAGIPAIDHRAWLRVAATTPRLPEMARELDQTRAELAELRREFEALTRIVMPELNREPR